MALPLPSCIIHVPPTSTSDSILAPENDVQAVSHTMTSSDYPITNANIVLYDHSMEPKILIRYQKTLKPR